jgi:transposase
MRCTAVINRISGLLLLRGITLRKGKNHVDAALSLILEDTDAKLSGAVRMLLAHLKLDLDQLALTRLAARQRRMLNGNWCWVFPTSN